MLRGSRLKPLPHPLRSLRSRCPLPLEGGETRVARARDPSPPSAGRGRRAGDASESTSEASPVPAGERFEREGMLEAPAVARSYEPLIQVPSGHRARLARVRRLEAQPMSPNRDLLAAP